MKLVHYTEKYMKKADLEVYEKLVREKLKLKSSDGLLIITGMDSNYFEVLKEDAD